MWKDWKNLQDFQENFEKFWKCCDEFPGKFKKNVNFEAILEESKDSQWNWKTVGKFARFSE